ncbi:MAG: hypothetical protein SFY66_24590 [Oculatellaceae cyanobacterium bins.114]|nr:hypothetical protein [Oculatellaceae cyanobacterium bins.114]
MRVLPFTVLSALFVTGLAIATSDMATSSVELNVELNTDTNQPHLVGNTNRRDTSYRGSGRREIVAFPLSVLINQA